MKQLLIILTIVITSFAANSQLSRYECDSIYEFTEQMPVYENGIPGLLTYLRSDLMPILVDCNKRDGILPSNIYLSLTINDQDKVIDVEFQRIQASEQCKEELQERLLKMTGWTSGMQDGIAVYSKFGWPISCINWQ